MSHHNVSSTGNDASITSTIHQMMRGIRDDGDVAGSGALARRGAGAVCGLQGRDNTLT